jgi:molecular chaperone GrpE
MNTETMEPLENQESGKTESGHTAEAVNQEKDENMEGVENIEEGSESPEAELTAEEKLKAELDNSLLEVEKFKDSWLRERAEFVNYKKRTASELLNSRKEAVRQFIHDILSPMDNLDLVTNVKTENSELKAFVDGVKMVQKEFIGIIEREGIKKLEPVGEAFDPTTMEAISSEESEEYKEEVVIEVFQPGYCYVDAGNKHSIRPSRVKVGKPVSENQM